ncbi:pre-rRNA-processing ESF1-like protein [Tasmannia lanceolata]|uniref:pre-rRNA-processing ESF1-like protein n=1 Tax=Tasmannia lanceolata TaxID=3420 RepID=UPI0040644CF4
MTNENNNKKKNKMKNKNKGRGKGCAQDNIITDSRFSSLHSDPRFQLPHKHQSKIPIDSRFNRMFSDKNFSSSSALDKRGKPKKENTQNPLLHYYKEEEEEEEEKAEKLVKNSDSDSESSESESLSVDEDVNELVGESGSSSTDSDDDGDEIYSEEDVDSDKEDVPLIEGETHRLAIVDMDWSHVKAVDLYVLLSSFLPKGGQILSVAVYPSEFGLKRMEHEAVHGPADFFDSDDEHSDDDDDDAEIDTRKLRAYEKSRLRYYYAVVECDSSATADRLYKTCDGLEFERTSNVLDLRFIPDSTEFKHPPRDIATEAPTNYKSLDFQTRALQHSNIHISWDEDEPHREKILKRKFNPDQVAELELKEFLASDDEETDDNENDEKRDMYRNLVQSGDGSDADDDNIKDMEVTFNTGLEEISKRILEKKKDKKSETVWEAYLRKRSEKKKARKNGAKYSSEDDISDSDQSEAPDQPDDFFVEDPLEINGNVSNKKDSLKKSKAKKNRKERKLSPDANKEQEASRAELELLLADDQGNDRGLKGYNLKAKKVKGKKGKEMPANDMLPTVDHDDPRFLALFTSHLFALDPTDPQFKRSATYARQLLQKQQKGAGEVSREEETEPSRKVQLLSDNTSSKKAKHSESDDMPSKKDKHELSSLVRSVKRKVGTLQS